MNRIRQQIVLWDELAIISIITRRGSLLNRCMKGVSKMGDGYLWAVLSLLLYTVADLSRTWLYTGMLAFAVEILTYMII